MHDKELIIEILDQIYKSTQKPRFTIKIEEILITKCLERVIINI